VPAAIKAPKAPVKQMQILTIQTNKKKSPSSSPDKASPPKSNGKFVPPGKKAAMSNGHANGDAKTNGGDDWW
jgi:hypothetical protein